MPIEYRLLGPLEAVVDGKAVALGGPKHKAVLALLLAEADAVVPASRLVDELWGDEPPSTATNLVHRAVSHLRKALGKTTIETRGTGYVVHPEPGSLDLHRFERLAHEGSRALADGQLARAAELLAEALALWRGPALSDLADEPGAQPLAGRLDELRTLARERRLEAELALGNHPESITTARELVREHPLRERPVGLLMLALNGSGRQVEALETYREARSALVTELGIEPGRWLREVEASILRQDPIPGEAAPAAAPSLADALRSIVVALLDAAALEPLLALAEPLARDPRRELVLVHTVPGARELSAASARLQERREVLRGAGIETRAAAFTSVTPGVDLARLSLESDVDLVVVDAPDGLLEDARLLTLLERAPCDVAVVVPGEPGRGGVFVPFAGAEHDWAAVELGAWLARNIPVRLRLAGTATGAEGRDASRLLASATLAVQRALGVSGEPVLVEPTPEALVAAADGATAVVVGLTDRWRRDGLGRTRTALATDVAAPTVLVRRGLRPGGLAPRESETRYTWTIAGG